MSAVAEAFAARAPYRAGEGEAVCIWQRGREVAHCLGGQAAPGRAWGEDTLVPIYSATKPLAAACVLLALWERGLTPAAETGEIWPACPAPRCTVAQMLSHQAGLAATQRSASVYDFAACRAALEDTPPAWGPPQHGYHPHTFGPIADTLVQCLVGMRLAAFWEQRVRRPLGLEVYIGLPAAEASRVALLRAPRLVGAMPRSEFYSAYFSPGSPVYRAFHSVVGIDSVRDMNTLRAQQCACPARGGVACARGLAMAYQAILGELEGSPFPPEVSRWLSTEQCRGRDATLCCTTAFTCGAMCAPERFFGRGGFGHAGAGGFHAFAEPGTGCSFAYVMNQMQLGILPGERVAQLVSAFLWDTPQ